MKKHVLILAAAGCLLTAPAFAGQAASPDRPITVADDLCIGPACVGVRDHDEYRYRDHREGCREVTVRERDGDRFVERRQERCDD